MPRKLGAGLPRDCEEDVEELGSGTLPRKELKEAADHLTTIEAGLIAIGEPAVEEALDKAIFGAIRVHKLFVDGSADEIAAELREVLKGY
jgi:hypothetical protein